MEKLLAFATELQAQGGGSANPPPPSNPQNLDTSVLDHIFGSNPADEMRHAMDGIEDESVPLDQKEIAFDNLEMLVEQIDNANNLKPLQMWPRLLKQLDSPEPSLRKLTAWVIATAVQNNPRSQNDLIENDGLTKLFASLDKEDSDEAKNKILYAITSELKHNEPGVLALDNIENAWDQLDAILTLKHSNMTKRVIFFFNSLLIQDDKSKQVLLEKAKSYSFTDKVYQFALQHSADEDCVAKALHTLALFFRYHIIVSDVNGLVQSVKEFQTIYPEIFTTEEWKSFHDSLEKSLNH
ncbi:hsp70-like protein [Schizosaccharomyces cryophilus OY26]|uniref:Hsp70-like protein n=1 Tax=Schizosaccharomyces cryophilus (strain OY26 / ATCC MYA-4695 / CBS 11777 / NBRC 106824 / NRRL Y48691) TaxID=653667 RepID=S9X8S5_SCHCR|nr:hsp70-like protein [Schizosaccharomyces cryophilus OY26]EPY53572.1 hsp70-like protein [Schizosaccharomyces cryophilus OY26]